MGTGCSKCNKTGWIKVAKDGNEYLKKCSCLKHDRVIKKSERSNIPPRFIGFELNSFFPVEGFDSQKRVLQLVTKFIDTFPVVEKGILFQGDTGVGKTRLLSSIATALYKKNENIDIYYADWNEIVREMKSGESHQQRDFSKINGIIERMSNADLLLFDEIGASDPSQWVRDNIYFVINNRYNNSRITLFASNYGDESINGKQTLKDRIGDRIRSRIYAMADSINIKGPDYRKKYE